MNNPKYQEFLHLKHASRTTSTGLINLFVKEATDDAVASIQRLIKGENNEVYDVTTVKGKQVIVRISHNDDEEWKPFFVEQWVYTQLKKIAVPVPHVLLVKEFKVDDKDRAVSVQEKLPGNILNEIELPEEMLKLYLKQAGGLLEKIHTVRTEGYGGIDKQGKGKYDTFAIWMNRVQWHAEEAEKIVKEHGMDEEVSRKLLRILADYKKYISDFESSHLVYYDYGAKHLFVLNGKITGIIDAEICFAGDSFIDFARWDFYFAEKHPLAWLLAGYEKIALNDEFYLKLHVFRIRQAITTLIYDYSQGNALGVQTALRNMKKDVEFFTQVGIF